MTVHITIETTTGAMAPKAPEEYTLEDVLVLRRLPPNLFQAYLVGAAGQMHPIPADTPLRELPPEAEIALRCIMNPNFSEFIEMVVTRHRVANPVTTLPDVLFGKDGCEKVVYEVDAERARQIVEEKVVRFVREHSRADPVLVGVSGGGDSNALLGALRQALAASGRRLLAYTLVCEPMWPEASAERARALCHRHSVEHLLIDGPGMARVTGMKSSVPAFHEAFLHRYGRNTTHFFATYMISAVARRLCREHGTDEYCLGFNREDVLAEMLFSVMNGRRPLEYPVRRFGNLRLLMPVWELPKLLLDACYPEYSRQNYEHRLSTTPQRGLIYFLAHGIEGLYNNLGLSLLRGVGGLCAANWPELIHQEAFDLYLEPTVTAAEAEDTQAFLAKHFYPGTEAQA